MLLPALLDDNITGQYQFEPFKAPCPPPPPLPQPSPQPNRAANTRRARPTTAVRPDGSATAARSPTAARRRRRRRARRPPFHLHRDQTLHVRPQRRPLVDRRGGLGARRRRRDARWAGDQLGRSRGGERPLSIGTIGELQAETLIVDVDELELKGGLARGTVATGAGRSPPVSIARPRASRLPAVGARQRQRVHRRVWYCGGRGARVRGRPLIRGASRAQFATVARARATVVRCRQRARRRRGQRRRPRRRRRAVGLYAMWQRRRWPHL